MNTITVSASRSYNVHIGDGLHKDIGKYVSQICKGNKVIIISDSNVWPLYGDTVAAYVRDAGYTCLNYVFPAGEESKSPETYIQIINFLAQNKLTRADMLIALGGGVVGDITGFAAATYLRGISFLQMPTTLLAMVDSSVGGKTAIDLTAGKNLVGAFYQPSLVICDTTFLSTLPKEIFCDGCAEVIKYGVLYDSALFAHLSENGLGFDRNYVISRCIALKRDVVAEDEFDTGARQMLNLGHTIGHGVEAKSNYGISHGQSVAIGMSIVARSAVNFRLCDGAVADQVVSVLKAFHLPVSTDYTAEDLYTYALSDKKRAADTVNLIVPETIGKCVIRPTPINELKAFIEAGL